MKTALLALLIPVLSLAQEVKSQSRISVIGEAELELEADYIQVELGVYERGEAAEVMEKMSTKMAAIVAEVKKQNGVQKLHTDLVQYHMIGRERETSMEARQGISFWIPVTASYDDLLQKLSKLGVNEVRSVRFVNSKASEYEQKLRLQACENAKIKATDMAAVYGAKVGRVLHISEEPEQASEPMALKSLRMATEGSSIVAGKIRLAVRVYVEFELQ